MKDQAPNQLEPHRFEHEAMATTFVIRIHHLEARYARQAAMEAFRLCDRLELELSRFIESSSISRLNRAQPGQDIPLHADAYLCLRQALHIAAVTGGAFDIGFRSRAVAGLHAYGPPISLSEESVSAIPLRSDPDLDLGGIGKGYAIDRMSELLAEWSIESALVTGGGSSVLAMGPPPGKPGWPVNLPGASGKDHYLPSGWSISASGFAVRKGHVKDPATGEKAKHAVRAWAMAPSAAVSDALSTAILAMSRPRVEEFLKDYPECGVAIEYEDQPPELAGREIPSC